MPNWSIGPIVGKYQPENFDEKQSSEWKAVPLFAVVTPLLFQRWNPREVTLSFVVNAMGVPQSERFGQEDVPVKNAIDQSDPEVVWAMICAMMRPDTTLPGRALYPPPILGGERAKFDYPRVVIPGWNVGNNTPSQAIIESASIKRTHIAGNPSRAVRAIITVTLREYRTTTDPERAELSGSLSTQQKRALAQGRLVPLPAR